jgi:hypothetical protein
MRLSTSVSILAAASGDIPLRLTKAPSAVNADGSKFMPLSFSSVSIDAAVSR